MSGTVPIYADITLSNRQYRIHELTDRDHEQLHEYAQSQFIQMARASVNPDSPHYHPTMAVALAEAAEIVWFRPPGRRFIAKRNGTWRLLWQSLHLENLSFEDFIKAVDKSDNREIDVAFEHFNRINKSDSSKKVDPNLPQPEKVVFESEILSTGG